MRRNVIRMQELPELAPYLFLGYDPRSKKNELNEQSYH
jgi:hypothetical protein